MPATHFERLISASVDEFVRGVRAAFPDAAQVDGTRCTIAVPPVTLAITLTPLAPRRIALLALPQLNAAFAFEGGSAAEQARLLEHLDRSMHRGGG
ncbi:MAG TPA: hypothetical protein VIS73_07395 [Rhodocyclaceae bacterium]